MTKQEPVHVLWQVSSILYDVCRFFSLQQRENTGAGICSDEILLSGNCPQNYRKKLKKNVSLWIMREADIYDEHPGQIYECIGFYRQIRSQVDGGNGSAGDSWWISGWTDPGAFVSGDFQAPVQTTQIPWILTVERIRTLQFVMPESDGVHRALQRIMKD